MIFAQTENGDLEVTNNLRLETNLAQIVLSKLGVRYRFQEGEWFKDAREGGPYRRLVFGKVFNFPLVKKVFERIALGCPGVKRLVSSRFDLGADRILRPRMTVELTDGQTVTLADQGFFVGVSR